MRSALILTLSTVLILSSSPVEVLAGNLPQGSVVSEIDAIDGGGKGGGTFAASFVPTGASGIQALLPWLTSLLVVLGIGIALVLVRPKRTARTQSGYTIIEEKV